MPSLSSVCAGSYILRLHLTTPHTQTWNSRTLTTPATTPPKEMPTPTGTFVAVCTQKEKKPVYTTTRLQRSYISPTYIHADQCLSGETPTTSIYKRLQDHKYIRIALGCTRATKAALNSFLFCMVKFAWKCMECMYILAWASWRGIQDSHHYHHRVKHIVVKSS